MFSRGTLFVLFAIALSSSNASLIDCIDDKIIISPNQTGQCPFEYLGYYNSKLEDQPCENADWITRIARESPSLYLSALSIPGTHDTTALIAGRIKQCQTQSITQQLNSGIRYLDMRMWLRMRDGKIAYEVHHASTYNCITLDGVLDQVVEFFAKHP